MNRDRSLREEIRAIIEPDFMGDDWCGSATCHKCGGMVMALDHKVELIIQAVLECEENQPMRSDESGSCSPSDAIKKERGV